MIAHMEKGLDPAELAKNVDTHGQSPWHFSKNKLCLTYHGRILIHPRAKPVELCPSGYFEGRLPLGKPGRPDDIAKVVLFLVSAAADYMTGSLLAVDGGYLLT